MRNVSEKYIKTHILGAVYIYIFLNRVVDEIMWQNSVQSNRA